MAARLLMSCATLAAGLGGTTPGARTAPPPARPPAFASALRLLRHGDLAALAAARADEPVSSVRLNGRIVYLVSETQLARQVCVEHAASFSDRNDRGTHDLGIVSAVGCTWAANRRALSAALMGKRARRAHEAAVQAVVSSDAASALLAAYPSASPARELAPAVRALTATIVARIVLGCPEGPATDWRPLERPLERPLGRQLERPLERPLPPAWPRASGSGAPAVAAPRARRGAALRRHLRALRQTCAHAAAHSWLRAQQCAVLAARPRAPFFRFVVAFTGRDSRVARTRARLLAGWAGCGRGREAESDAQLVQRALAHAHAARRDGAPSAAEQQGGSVLACLLGAAAEPTPSAAAAAACPAAAASGSASHGAHDRAKTTAAEPRARAPAEPGARALPLSLRTPAEPGARALLQDLLVAGSSTTASAALSALLLLEADDGARARVLKECARVLGAEGGASAAAEGGGEDELPPVIKKKNADLLAAMPFTVACVREAMRLNPPAPLIFRVANAEARLVGPAGEALLVAPGSAVVMSSRLLSTDPRAWPRPHAFWPERWLGGGGGGGGAVGPSAPALSEMSFGAGPRACVGEQMAMTIAPLLVGHVLRQRVAMAVASAPPSAAAPSPSAADRDGDAPAPASPAVPRTDGPTQRQTSPRPRCQ